MKLTPISLGGPANPDGYFYTDALAIYQGKDGAGNWTGQPEDPENQLSWVLKDANGERLYINFDLPYQWTANITDPGWQSRMAQWLLSQASHYTGVFLDDVNFASTAPQNGAIVPPTVTAAGVLSVPVIGGNPISATQWAADLATYCSLLRTLLKSIFPQFRVLHNTFWRDPLFQAGLYTADVFTKEGGFTDSGLTGGTGYWSLSALFQWADAIHQAGAGVHILENSGGVDCMYSICASLLMTNGADFWEVRGTPDPASAALLATDLGNPLTSRYRSTKGLWMRAFEGGTIFVNEPGAPLATICGVELQAKNGLAIFTA